MSVPIIMVLVGVIILLLLVILALCYQKYKKSRNQVDFAEEQYPSIGYEKAQMETKTSTVVADNSVIVNVVGGCGESNDMITD